MRIVLYLLIIVFIAAVPVSSAAEDQPGKIKNTINSSISTRKSTQEEVAEWQSEKERLKSRYFQLKDTLDAQKLEIKHMQDVVDRQGAFMDRMQRQIIEMEKIRQNLIPFLSGVLDKMKDHMDKDLPFLIRERSERIQSLRQLIHDPELTMGEKIRRVFEGLRVEMDYGKSVETAKEHIIFDGEEIMVNVLRLGRTALLMETLDENHVGMYAGGNWKEIPGRYAGEIRKAIEITERRRPIEFVNLPVRGELIHE